MYEARIALGIRSSIIIFVLVYQVFFVLFKNSGEGDEVLPLDSLNVLVTILASHDILHVLRAVALHKTHGSGQSAVPRSAKNKMSYFSVN